jgi:hypothetical protein
LVVYLDLLGLKEKMEGLQGDQTKFIALLNSYKTALDSAITELRPHNAFPDLWRVKIFTDNIVLAIPMSTGHGEHEFGIASVNVASFQLALATEGWFVRGGMAIGPLYIDDNIVFGPALVDAYTLESKYARDPRVVLSTEVTRMCKSHLRFYAEPFKSPQNGYVLIDTDGHSYINYLYDPIGMEAPIDVILDAVRIHKRKIEEKLRETNSRPDIWAKFRWAANYHDFFCRKWLPNHKRISISKTALRNEPSLLVPKRTQPIDFD